MYSPEIPLLLSLIYLLYKTYPRRRAKCSVEVRCAAPDASRGRPQIGSLAGAVHLLKDNAGVPGLAQ